MTNNQVAQDTRRHNPLQFFQMFTLYFISHFLPFYRLSRSRSDILLAHPDFWYSLFASFALLTLSVVVTLTALESE